MRQLTIHKGYILPKRRGVFDKRRTLLSEKVRISSFSLMVMIIVMICLMSLLFLGHFNNVATKGYMVRKLEMERMNLIKQNEVNEILVSQSRTLEAVRNSAKVQKMIKSDPNKIVYIQGDTVVASK